MTSHDREVMHAPKVDMRMKRFLSSGNTCMCYGSSIGISHSEDEDMPIGDTLSSPTKDMSGSKELGLKRVVPILKVWRRKKVMGWDKGFGKFKVDSMLAFQNGSRIVNLRNGLVWSKMYPHLTCLMVS